MHVAFTHLHMFTTPPQGRLGSAQERVALHVWLRVWLQGGRAYVKGFSFIVPTDGWRMVRRQMGFAAAFHEVQPELYLW